MLLEFFLHLPLEFEVLKLGSGEIAAAYAAGHISSSYAMAIAFLRGHIVSTIP